MSSGSSSPVRSGHTWSDASSSKTAGRSCSERLSGEGRVGVPSRESMLATVKARFSGLPPAYRTGAMALLVAASYYAGANLGFILRLPPTVPSVLWPPNAILTATLLLTPRRRWWIYLLAAFPAHLAAELPAWPLPLVLLLFVTNCSEALLG